MNFYVIEDGDGETLKFEFLQSIQQRRHNVHVNIVGNEFQKVAPKLKRTKGALEESSNKSQYRCKT